MNQIHLIIALEDSEPCHQAIAPSLEECCLLCIDQLRAEYIEAECPELMPNFMHALDFLPWLAASEFEFQIKQSYS